MKAHKLLRHAVTPASGTLNTTPGKYPVVTARAWAARGILVMALALGTLGAVAAMSVHSSVGNAAARPSGALAANVQTVQPKHQVKPKHHAKKHHSKKHHAKVPSMTPMGAWMF
jgi:hypothetical protein